MSAAAPVLATVPLLFAAEHRYTGTALGWNLGAITAGATTPPIAFWLVDRFDTSIAPAGVCLVGAAVGLLAARMIDRRTRTLDV
jgi:MHS family proline/betaine transporter-like MFS transporter